MDSLRGIADSKSASVDVVKSCVALSAILDNYDVGEAIEYGEKALRLAKEMDYTIGIAIANEQLGKCYHNNTDDSSAIEYYKKALMSFLILNEKPLVYRCLNKIGTSYFRLGEYEKAKKYIKRSLNYSITAQDTSNMINCYTNLGGICSNQSDYHAAIEYFKTALELSEKFNETYVQGVILIGIGRSLNKINNSRKAKGYFFNALNILHQFKSKDYLPACYLQLADIYMDERQMDSAAVMISNAMQYARNSHNIPAILNTVYTQGELFKRTDKSIKALKLQKRVLDVSRFHNIPHYQTLASAALSELYYNLGNYSKAEEFALSTLKEARKLKTKESKFVVLNVLYKIYKNRGDISKALRYHEKYTQVKDSVYNLETAEVINEYEAKYKAEKRKKEILELSRKNQQQEIILLKERKTKQIQLLVFSVGFVFLISGLVIAYLKVKTKKEKDIAELKQKRFHDVIQAAEEERKRIASDLHDSVGLMLATTKLNINELEDSPLLRDADDEKGILVHTKELIDDTSIEVRNISHNLMPGALIELGLKAALKDLIKKINQIENFAAQLTTEGNEIKLPEMQSIAVFRIIQEITGNTLKHAQANKVTLNLAYKEKYLIIVYVDNGIGIRDISMDSSTGIGWKNIYSRLEILNASLDFDDKYSKGTKIILQIPINR